jgi:two-component system, cell cycle sensor histidine kinase and response regulator CckA
MRQRECKKTALFVDDEVMIHEIVKNAMDRWSFSIISAGNGKEAVRIYEKEKGRIDLVILDMVLKDIHGYEVYNRIKRINPEVKVLLMTGNGIDANVRKILSCSLNSIIHKPFHIMHFHEKLNDMLPLNTVAGQYGRSG